MREQEWGRANERCTTNTRSISIQLREKGRGAGKENGERGKARQNNNPNINLSFHHCKLQCSSYLTAQVQRRKKKICHAHNNHSSGTHYITLRDTYKEKLKKKKKKTESYERTAFSRRSKTAVRKGKL